MRGSQGRGCGRPAIEAKQKRKIGAPGTIRTSDPQIRSLMLYPAELRARTGGRYIVASGIVFKPVFALSWRFARACGRGAASLSSRPDAIPCFPGFSGRFPDARRLCGPRRRMALAGARAGFAERTLRSCGRIGAGRSASLRCRAAGDGRYPRSRSSRARSASCGGARSVGRCAEDRGDRRIGGGQRRCGRKRVGGGRASAQPARTRGGAVRGGCRSARRVRIRRSAARGGRGRPGASSRSLRPASVRASALASPHGKSSGATFMRPYNLYVCRLRLVYDCGAKPVAAD